MKHRLRSHCCWENFSLRFSVIVWRGWKEIGGLVQFYFEDSSVVRCEISRRVVDGS